MVITLRQARLFRKLSQKEMGIAIDVSLDIYQDYEENPHLIPVGKAVRIAKELQMEVKDIFLDEQSSLTRGSIVNREKFYNDRRFLGGVSPFLN